MPQSQISRDQLVEDSVFILQCLRQNARGGRANDFAEVRSTLAGSVALDLGAYVTSLKKVGYLQIDGHAAALKAYPALWEALPWLARGELSRRVRREVEAQAQLEHPCVLPILEVRGEDAQVVMALASGTLRDKPSRGGDRLPLQHAVRLAAQVAHALAHAHAQGLTRGALKPENVLLDRAGNALLSDFGA